MPELLCQVRAERSQQDGKRLFHLTALTLQLRQFVEAHHEGGNRRIVGERLDVGCFFLDEGVQCLEFFFRSPHRLPQGGVIAIRVVSRLIFC